MYKYSIAIKKCNIVSPRPILKKLLKDIGYPSCSETPKEMMVLGEPIGVMLPPRFAPTIKPHHICFPRLSVSMPLTIGAKDVERGMLSITEDASPESHMMAIDALNGVPPIRLDSPSETISINPILSIPLIMMKSPDRKRMLDQSMSLNTLLGSFPCTISIRHPPDNATKAGVRLMFS